MDLSYLGLVVSFIMSLYLFIVAFIEALNISNNEEGKVRGGTLIMSLTLAFVFSGFTYIFNF
ncbi:hypothetical protein D0469_04785 [Peribacillus saganii]|uniref:Uncharacterized protein n=1 Tax=Peribacillus saganii TaxID=2303992 RepID=A0A372LSJ8_9BACI|nr:hypothetical protein [Peribacillus saganii]RFU70772.1 hypothetical protein D0469_04785 [Peribacillus saganii]